MEGDDTRVGRGDLMQSDFVDVDLPLVNRPGGNEAFHCIELLACMVAGVNHMINNAIASNAQDFNKFEGSSINECSNGQMDGFEDRINLQRHGVYW